MRWLADHVEDGEVAYRIGREGNELVAEWLGVVRLVAQRDGGEHRFERSDTADPASVEKIERGSAQLLLRHLRGALSFHGAAVATREGAVVLLGASSAGKSTLVASLCQHDGVVFLADDAVALDRDGEHEVVVPLERDHWLEPSARRALGSDPNADTSLSKERVRPARIAVSPVPLVAFVELCFDANLHAPTLRAVEGIEALGALMPQVVRFVIDEPGLQRAELDALVELLGRVPLLRLSRPRGFQWLDEAATMILQLAHGTLSPRRMER